MRRLLSLFVPMLLLVTGMVGVVVASPASADTTSTTLSFNCNATNVPFVGSTTLTQALGFDTTAPASVEAGSTFQVAVVSQPLQIPSSQSASGVSATVNHITNVTVRIPLPANATYVSSSLSGGSNLNSTPTLNLVGSNLELKIPGPLAGGSTVQPPTVIVNLRATGAPGTTVAPAILNSDQGYDLTVNISVLGQTADLPTTCTPSPDPALSSTSIVADTTAPTVSVTTPADGAGYSLGAPVHASYACADSASGVATCAGDVADGALVDTSTIGAHSFTVSATDNAGNPASRTVTYNVIAPSGDTTAPTITLTTPAQNAVFQPNQVVSASYTCADDVAVASCTGTLANGAAINTAVPGTKSFTVTAVDTAGNPRTVVRSYTVLATPGVVTFKPHTGSFGGCCVNFNRSSNTDVSVRVTAPVANGGALAVGDRVTVEYSIYHPSLGVGATSNWGPDPMVWTLPAPTNATINPGSATADENGLNGETHGNAHAGGNSTGLKSPITYGSGNSNIVVNWDDNSVPAAVPIQNGDGVLTHVTYTATVTTPGPVTIQGFDPITGTDCGAFGASCGSFSSDAFPTSSIGIAFTARDTTAPTIAITSPVDGGLYAQGSAVNAGYSCADDTSLVTCIGDVANGSALDTLTSGPHQFHVTATDAAGNVAQTYLTYQVTAPTVDLHGCTVNEGGSCVLTATLSNASTIPVSVHVDTSDGTAVAPGRYTAQSTVLTFAPGQTSKTVSVATIADGVQEPDQTFTVDLSSPVGVYLGTAEATGTIHDTSTAPILMPESGTVHRSSSSGTVELDIPIGLANQFGTPKASGLTITADWTTADWYSHAPADYTPASGTVTFLPGETEKMVAIQVPPTAVASIVQGVPAARVQRAERHDRGHRPGARVRWGLRRQPLGVGVDRGSGGEHPGGFHEPHDEVQRDLHEHV